MRLATIVLSVGLLVGAGDPADAVKKEMMRLEGEWSMVSGEREGNPLPEAMVKKSRRVAKDGETAVTIGGIPFLKAKYTVDPAKKPKTIDYVLTDGTSKGKTQLGIYELDGDTVKFCFAAPGKDRPDDFTAKEGSGRAFSVWKRDKK